ncbi:MAG: hypothetical protein ACPLPT_00335 [Moorellales bacterium]
MGLGLILAGLLVVAQPSPEPSRQEIERQARALGMVYRDEVVAWAPEPAPTSAASSGGGSEDGGSGEVQVYIPPGFTSYQVAELLARQGLVEDAAAFERLIGEMGASRRLVAGYHRLRLPADPREIVEELTRQGR